MRPTELDLIVLVYNFAVVLSGAYVISYFDIGERWVLFGMSFLIAILWTIYFRMGMVSRLAERIETSEDETEASS